MKELSQLRGDAFGSVSAAGNSPGNAQPCRALGVVRLVPRPWDDQHGLSRTHPQRGRADTAVMNDGGGPKEQLRKRGIITSDHTVRQFACQFLRTFEDENRPAAQQFCGGDAMLKKLRRAWIVIHGGTEREHDRRRAIVQESSQLTW